MNRKVVLFSAIAIGLCGCGKEQGKLSGDQASKLNDTLTAIGRIERAGTAAKAPPRAAAATSVEDEIQKKMAAKLMQSSCTIDLQSPDPGSTNISAKFKVGGKSCPV